MDKLPKSFQGAALNLKTPQNVEHVSTERKLSGRSRELHKSQTGKGIKESAEARNGCHKESVFSRAFSLSGNLSGLNSPGKYSEQTISPRNFKTRKQSVKKSQDTKSNNEPSLPYIQMKSSKASGTQFARKCQIVKMNRNYGSLFASQDTHGLTLERLFSSSRDIKDVLSIVSPKLLNGKKNNGKRVFETELQDVKDEEPEETVTKEKMAADMAKWKGELLKNHSKKDIKELVSPYKLKKPDEVISAYEHLVNWRLARTYKQIASSTPNIPEECPHFDFIALNRKAIKEVVCGAREDCQKDRECSEEESNAGIVAIDEEAGPKIEPVKNEDPPKKSVPAKTNIIGDDKGQEKLSKDDKMAINLKAIPNISKRHKEFGRTVREAERKHLKLAELAGQYKEELYAKRFKELKGKNRYELEEVLTKPTVGFNNHRKQRVTHHVQALVIKGETEKILGYIKQQYTERKRRKENA